MLYHKAHVKLLGKMHTITSRRKEAALKNYVEFQRDHSERYTPRAPNGQIQSEAFRMGYVEFFFQEYDECGNKTEGGYLLNEKFVSKMLKEYKIDVSFE